jgi:hypothetical protein
LKPASALGVEITGALSFIPVHVESNDQVSRLLLRGYAVRIDGLLFAAAKVASRGGSDTGPLEAGSEKLSLNRA